MKPITATALVLTASRPALADFKVYVGEEYSFTEGGGVVVLGLNLFNNPPDCDDEAVQYTQSINNDASEGGFACDGCEQSEDPEGWDIERFELPHDQEWDGEEVDGPLTIYNLGDGEYELKDDGENVWGSCERPSDPDTLECSIPGGTDSKTDIFDCITNIVIPDSN